MALRRLFGCLPAAALAVCAVTACKGSAPSTAAVDKRCDQLAKVCGEKDKHIEKMLDECKQAAKPQVEKGCTDKVVALYDCYEKELCGAGDKVWTLDDLGVLAQRHKKCGAEQKALRECSGK